MYFPLLRARQFELITIRELAIENALGRNIMPIFEPIKESVSNLKLANDVLTASGNRSYLILNPLIGDVDGDTDHYLNFFSDLANNSYLPAFHYRNNADYILSRITEFDLNQCMIICDNDLDSSDSEFTGVIENERVSHITVKDPRKNRSLDRYIKGLAKFYIRLDDLFEKENRNSDYLDIDAHRFSEEHLYFADENYQGFSDYTVLPSEFSDGGSTPRAVVIHLTYMDESNRIWIRHFTSTTNDSIANVQGKFAEAAQKAVEFCQGEGLFNSATEELISYYEQAHYPGLGVVKKISIKNHLLIVGEYLNN